MANTGWRTASAFTLAAVIGLSGTLAAQKPAKQKPNQVRVTDDEPAVTASPELAAAFLKYGQGGDGASVTAGFPFNPFCPR